MTVAKFFRLLRRKGNFSSAIINKDEVIARTIHFCEFQNHERKLQLRLRTSKFQLSAKKHRRLGEFFTVGFD